MITDPPLSSAYMAITAIGMPAVLFLFMFLVTVAMVIPLPVIIVIIIALAFALSFVLSVLFSLVFTPSPRQFFDEKDGLRRASILQIYEITNTLINGCFGARRRNRRQRLASRHIEGYSEDDRADPLKDAAGKQEYASWNRPSQR